MVAEDEDELYEYEFTPEEAMHRRDRKPQAVLSEGQAVFWRYSSGMLTTLLHFSLAGGKSLEDLPTILRRPAHRCSIHRFRVSSHNVSLVRDWLSNITIARRYIQTIDGDDTSPC